MGGLKLLHTTVYPTSKDGPEAPKIKLKAIIIIIKKIFAYVPSIFLSSFNMPKLFGAFDLYIVLNFRKLHSRRFGVRILKIVFLTNF